MVATATNQTGSFFAMMLRTRREGKKGGELQISNSHGGGKVKRKHCVLASWWMPPICLLGILLFLTVSQVHRSNRHTQVGSSSASSTTTSSSSLRFTYSMFRGGEEKQLLSVLPAISPFEGNKDVYTAFDANCVLMNKRGDAPRFQQDEEKKGGSSKKSDKLSLGRCQYYYPAGTPPEKGFLQAIDFFLYRDEHNKREQCYLFCIDHLDDNEITDTLLVEATTMGLTEVLKKLKHKYGLNPLALPRYKEDKPRFNAIQEAIRGGYATAVKILTDGNNHLVIDSLGRTVADYVRMKGSPILPRDAVNILSFNPKDLAAAAPVDQPSLRRASFGTTGQVHPDAGWNNKTSWKDDGVCGMDVIYGRMSRKKFYNDYFVPGRPFVLRNHVPEQEVRAFDKARWETTENFHSRTMVRVGPTAYPYITNQQGCSEEMTIAQIENATECPDQPGVPMVHARHPTPSDLEELYPMYDGNQYDSRGGWNVLSEWFDPEPWEFQKSWQVFFGGDGSGATLHWHLAAFNALYVGVKEWVITPPKYRGLTGMPALQAAALLDDSISVRCTQYPGDMMYIPDYWGHLTLNRGFAIGAAVILPQRLQMAADATGAAAAAAND
ncbi:hypothetical protein ACA910_007056 [Epithemia clementina (nom. ined.)]